MQNQSNTTSAWQRLVNQELSCFQALKLLVNEQGDVKQDLLDIEVTNRFLRNFPDKSSLPSVIPLLLWRGFYYLGSPETLSVEEIATLDERTCCEVQIISISDKSYRAWFHAQNSKIHPSTTPLVNPLTGEQEQEDITETTEIHLSQAVDQINRIKTLISGALRNRASDVHLEPMPEGLRVRYRIDGVLRSITTLPLDLGRRVIVALKVMCDMDISESRRPQDGRIEEKYTNGDQTELAMDMRVSTLPCVNGEKAVIRLLPRQNPYSQLDKLGFSEKTLPIY